MSNPNIDENNEEIEDESFMMAADHPLMDRLQKSLKEQLEGTIEKLNYEVKEAAEALKKVSNSRENIGVQLYGFQQQLAKLQIEFEEANEMYNESQRKRENQETNLENLLKESNKENKEVQDFQKRVTKCQEELLQLSRTLKQVEEYNVQMRSEIAIKRRSTYKAEEEVIKLEKDKMDQDKLIDNLNEQVKKLSETGAILSTQMAAQQEETANAKQILKEAVNEKERIETSKRSILEDWQNTLKDIQERDKNLSKLREFNQEESMKILNVQSEIQGTQREILAEVQIAEQHDKKLTKCLDESTALKKQKDDLDNDLKRLETKVLMLKESINLKENEKHRMDIENRELKTQQIILENEIVKKTRKVDELNNINMDSKNIMAANNNFLGNMERQLVKADDEFHDFENKMSLLDNQHENLKYKLINSMANHDLKDREQKKIQITLDKLEKEVRTNEEKIKDNERLIGKKQLQLDQLNKDYMRLLERNKGNEEVGELDLKLSYIKKKLEEQEERHKNLNNEWMKNQTQLIKIQEAKSDEIDSLKEIKNKKLVLDSKKRRIENQVETQEKEIKELKQKLKGLQNDLNRLNEAFFKFKSRNTQLNQDNKFIEQDFVLKLQEMEHESLEMEKKAEALRVEKQNILDKIVEAEKQICLWERKIQLEKEMQETIDPSIGQAEVEQMKKEIHRMELIFTSLKKQQEVLIQEMERAVSKRESIKLKYSTTQKAQPKPGENVGRQIELVAQTKEHLMQQISGLREEEDEKNRDNEEIMSNIQELSNEINGFNEQMEVHRPTFMDKNNEEMMIAFEREFVGAKMNYLDENTDGDHEEVDYSNDLAKCRNAFDIIRELTAAKYPQLNQQINKWDKYFA